jgi:hypothetical protein
MRTHTLTRPLVAALLTTAALTLGACGGDDPPSQADARAKARDAALKFAQCMRQHGVDMPDPGTGGRQVFKVGPGEDTTPEEMEAAQRACEKYQKDIKPPEMSPEEQAEFKKAALAHAQCMRDHGLDDFPDPTFGENGQAQIRIRAGSGMDPESPKFQAAQKACQSKMPKGPSTTSAGGE